jgi:hypothetical protein
MMCVERVKIQRLVGNGGRSSRQDVAKAKGDGRPAEGTPLYKLVEGARIYVTLDQLACAKPLVNKTILRLTRLDQRSEPPSRSLSATPWASPMPGFLTYSQHGPVTTKIVNRGEPLIDSRQTITFCFHFLITNHD